MQPVHAEWMRMDPNATVTLTELSQCCAMSESELDELVDYCALVPLLSPADDRAFSADWVGPLCSASKLRFDFDLDLFTVAILVGNFNRIETLEREVIALKALLRAQDT